MPARGNDRRSGAAAPSEQRRRRAQNQRGAAGLGHVVDRDLAAAAREVEAALVLVVVLELREVDLEALEVEARDRAAGRDGDDPRERRVGVEVIERGRALARLRDDLDAELARRGCADAQRV